MNTQTLHQESLSNKTVFKSVSLPSHVNRYLMIREQLDRLEKERRELEAQVIEWGLLEIGNGYSHGQTIAETDEKELLLTIRKPTVKDLKDLRLEMLQEDIEIERELAVAENQSAINELMAQQQVIKDKLAQLTLTPKGRALQEEYDDLVEILLGCHLGKLGVMLRNKQINRK